MPSFEFLDFSFGPDPLYEDSRVLFGCFAGRVFVKPIASDLQLSANSHISDGDVIGLTHSSDVNVRHILIYLNGLNRNLCFLDMRKCFFKGQTYNAGYAGPTFPVCDQLIYDRN